MSVRVALDLQETVYRRLLFKAEKAGVQVKTILHREIENSVTGFDDFAERCLTLDVSTVVRERMRVPLSERLARAFDAETDRLLALLRAEVAASPEGYLDFRADRTEGKENHG